MVVFWIYLTIEKNWQQTRVRESDRTIMSRNETISKTFIGPSCDPRKVQYQAPAQVPKWGANMGGQTYSFPASNDFQTVGFGPSKRRKYYDQNSIPAYNKLTPYSRNTRNSAVCSEHGKLRTLKNLSMNGKGEWVCMSGSECRALPNVGNEICSIHGKRRSFQNLGKNEEGKWVCVNGSECKLLSDTDHISKTCTIHGKKRSFIYLIEQSPGVYVCHPRSKCVKTSSPCSIFPNLCKQPVIYGPQPRPY